MKIGISFSYPNSQGSSGFGEFPNSSSAGFHRLYMCRTGERQSKVERLTDRQTDQLLRQALTGCLHLSECPVVPEPGPQF